MAVKAAKNGLVCVWTLAVLGLAYGGLRKVCCGLMPWSYNTFAACSYEMCLRHSNLGEPACCSLCPPWVTHKHFSQYMAAWCRTGSLRMCRAACLASPRRCRAHAGCSRCRSMCVLPRWTALTQAAYSSAQVRWRSSQAQALQRPRTICQLGVGIICSYTHTRQWLCIEHNFSPGDNSYCLRAGCCDTGHATAPCDCGAFTDSGGACPQYAGYPRPPWPAGVLPAPGFVMPRSIKARLLHALSCLMIPLSAVVILMSSHMHVA